MKNASGATPRNKNRNENTMTPQRLAKLEKLADELEENPFSSIFYKLYEPSESNLEFLERRQITDKAN